MSVKNTTLLDGGSILTQFAEQGIIDEYQIMLDPVILGDGTSIMKGIKHNLALKLIRTRAFKSGVVLLFLAARRKGIQNNWVLVTIYSVTPALPAATRAGR